MVGSALGRRDSTGLDAGVAWADADGRVGVVDDAGNSVGVGAAAEGIDVLVGGSGGGVDTAIRAPTLLLMLER